MTGVGIRAEVRQQRALLVAVVAATVTWLSLRQAVTVTIPVWVDWVRGVSYALIQLPAVAAFSGVWSGGRDRAKGIGQLRARAVRPLTETHLPTVAVGLGAVLAGWAAAAIVRAAHWLAVGAGGPDALNPAVVLVAVCWLTAVYAVGYALGLRGRSRWVVAPVYALIVFLAPLVATGVSGDMEAVTPIPWDLWQAHGVWVWSTILVASGMAIAAAAAGVAWLRMAIAPTRARAAAGIAATCLATALGVANFGAGSWRTIPDDDQLPPINSLACVAEGPARVCVHPAHARLLTDAQLRLSDTGVDAVDGAQQTLRLDVGLGRPPQALNPTTMVAGLDVLDGVASIPDCALAELLQRIDQPVAAGFEC